MNISSLTYHFDQLHGLLASLKVSFSIIGIKEKRINSSKNKRNNIDLDGYTIESTSTGASYVGFLLYIKENINYKIRKDVKICKY